jgi:hypothetical protein
VEGRVVNQFTFVDECETVVLEGLWDGGSDCDNAGDGFRIFWGSAKCSYVRYTKKICEHLPSSTSLPSSLLRFFFFFLSSSDILGSEI